MNREEIHQILQTSDKKEFLLELITGYGKSKIALDFIENKKIDSILIVIPKLVLIEGWKQEFIKWGYKSLLDKVTFVTYVSLPKYINTKFTYLILDEAHHLSERCKDALLQIKSTYKMFLSATVNRDLKHWLVTTYPKIRCIKITIKDAVENDVLPDPKIILLPLSLNYKDRTEFIVKKNKKNANIIECDYKDRWKYIGKQSVKIKCTPYEYYSDISSEITFWKKKAMYQEFAKTKWLYLCGERLKWLANQKNDLVVKLLNKMQDYKVLTFCSTIEQASLLGKNCINSKNSNNADVLELFNSNKIKHITAVNMLDEGVNIKDCKIGLFANINSSERITIQRIGRILRHKEPIIIYPYFRNTREEEIIKKIIENYNPELIKTYETEF